MTRPVVGICAAVRPARFGPWDQDVAMAPATLVEAVHELGWLAVLLTATETAEALELLDGVIAPDWGRNADFSRRLADAAEARGLPVVRLDETLLAPDSTVADYRRAIAELFTRDARASRV